MALLGSQSDNVRQHRLPPPASVFPRPSVCKELLVGTTKPSVLSVRSEDCLVGENTGNETRTYASVLA